MVKWGENKSNILDDILEAKHTIESNFNHSFSPYDVKCDYSSGSILGIPIFENKLLTQMEEYEEVIELSFKRRWIEPILHCNWMPFEPWVKTQIIKKTREVPMTKVIMTTHGLYMHPALKQELASLFKLYEA